MTKSNLTRRSFVKVSALAGAATAIGASMAGCMSESAPAPEEPAKETTATAESEPAEDSKAGLTKMRTSCHGCIQMCPAIAYLKDGVVVKLEGDPEAPVSRGSLCIKGLNQLHTMYSPRRVLHPLRRAGERGENKWEVISWDEAITEAATHIKDAIDKYGNYAFFASVGGGGSYSFMEAMTLPMAFGSPTVFEPGCAQCYLPRWALSKLFYGGDDQSIADNAVQEIFKPEDNQTEVVVIWGAQPSVSETAESGRGMAELRAAGVKTVVVDPNFSPDAVKADVWLPVRPGSDTKLLLSWFRYIFENKLYDEEFTKYWTNLPFLIDMDEKSERYKLPVLAQDIFPDFKQTTPENTPAYVCFDLKTNKVAPFEYSAPADATVDPEIFWAGEYEGKSYKTAGQIYKEEADPWTLEKTAEECWLQADKIEEAIKLYVENNGGIANGVASDMTESASQVPLGCMGLDSIMGRINKPGVTMTQKGGGYFAAESETGETKSIRPVTYNNGFGGMFSDMYGIGAVIGLSDAQNEERIKAMAETNGEMQKRHNQLLIDRLGMKDHKGLYAWCHSHIPTVRNAIATGEPFKPRVWFDMSGNKLAMLGNAKSWYEVFPEVDYIIGQYPMLTSFHIEACDLVFPLREWLEEPMVNMTQLDTQWLQNECTHIGETVSHSIPAAQVVNKCREMWGGEIPGGLMPGLLASATEAEVKQGVADTLGAPDWETLQANTDEYVPFVTPNYWNYGQHEQICDEDGLPSGFATESRKIETYCQMLIKMARTGYPYCYPEPQEACADYSPICCAIEPAESPMESAEGYDAEYPFVLTSGRVPYFHHGTMRHAPFSRELFPTAEIRINPASAKELGIEHMDWVKVTSRRGEVHARAYLTEGVNPKTVWMERFWNPECYDASQANPTGGWLECNVNVLTKNDAPFNEVYGSYTNRGFTVKIEKSTRPENIWVEPEEFAPFLPTSEMLAEPQTKDVF
ncbi:molybdopterin-containing oxidoreductase family protein [Xiamenia xianingshaonis]|uniref:Molybdopterin-dependent oxidoreductase n=1 Tax=Xiamenia xianingshaonis TaxID=2682776 RepID=A0A9E6STP0_9ACTN|nr:molybdopterin-dependent oxidoreductase [Xiamenia xianingshaonis]NGM17085.1 molybdopterin-dependent oxidoreductase [Eggerthellaceae bacterium zg-893]NHM13769.1 molybdopterin-dependent oxidoreductase [Xiamenia xianingshaonis]QTU83633.1 molybdopterin-dependent oxidoreductase [Xiamenia xianingshaonis]